MDRDVVSKLTACATCGGREYWFDGAAWKCLACAPAPEAGGFVPTAWARELESLELRKRPFPKFFAGLLCAIAGGVAVALMGLRAVPVLFLLFFLIYSMWGQVETWLESRHTHQWMEGMVRRRDACCETVPCKSCRYEMASIRHTTAEVLWHEGASNDYATCGACGRCVTVVRHAAEEEA